MFARCLSSLKDERVQASKVLGGPRVTQFRGDRKAFLEDIRKVSPRTGSGQGGLLGARGELLCLHFTDLGPAVSTGHCP